MIWATIYRVEKDGTVYWVIHRAKPDTWAVTSKMVTVGNGTWDAEDKLFGMADQIGKKLGAISIAQLSSVLRSKEPNAEEKEA